MARSVRLVVLAFLLACTAASLAPAAHAITGETRLLVIRVTWGPQPFADDVVRDVVFNQTATFLNTSSFGKVSLVGEATPWLQAWATRPTNCDAGGWRQLADQTARAAGYDLTRYNRYAYVFPRLECSWMGLGGGDAIWLNGLLYRKLVAHELGHTYGLSHARSWACRPGCVISEYGDPYDTMGGGDGDYNAFEKVLLGWVTSTLTARSNGVYTIDRPDRPSQLPQAFIVDTARTDYWFENRQEQVAGPVSSLLSEAFLPTGVLVRLSGPPTATPPLASIPDASYLLPDAGGLSEPALQLGQTFTAPGIFAVTVDAQLDGQSELRFRWVDRTAPTAPLMRAPAPVIRRRGRLEVSWDSSAELGSGVDHYEVTVDRRAAVRVRPPELDSPTLPVRMPATGSHRVAVVAVDRAGNHSKPALRRFVVRR